MRLLMFLFLAFLQSAQAASAVSPARKFLDEVKKVDTALAGSLDQAKKWESVARFKKYLATDAKKLIDKSEEGRRLRATLDSFYIYLEPVKNAVKGEGAPPDVSDCEPIQRRIRVLAGSNAEDATEADLPGVARQVASWARAFCQ
jgi:hypothetical protein